MQNLPKNDILYLARTQLYQQNGGFAHDQLEHARIQFERIIVIKT
jgi:hypothetical protein